MQVLVTRDADRVCFIFDGDPDDVILRVSIDAAVYVAAGEKNSHSPQKQLDQ